MADYILWIVLSLTVFFCAYLLYKLLRLYLADGDQVVISSKMKPCYFKDRVVWVTGASSGIGEEMCYQLSEMGAKVIMSSRNEAKLMEVKDKLVHPEDGRVLSVDLCDPEATRAATAKARDLFGKIDILVNNAGVSTRALFLDMEEQVHRKVMELNFFSPWILAQDTIPGMVENGFGHVVNISSIWGRAGPSNRSSYSSAKFAIIGLMDCVRNEMLCSSVYVTNVLPGPVVTMVGANALQGDGSSLGVNDSLIANGMKVERCVKLILTAVSNQQNEVWVSRQPYLVYPYLSHYFPSLLCSILEKRARTELKQAKKKKL